MTSEREDFIESCSCFDCENVEAFISRLRSQLAAEREKWSTTDYAGLMALYVSTLDELQAEREAVAAFIAQNRRLRHRAERMERVVEAARVYVAATDAPHCDVEEAVRALDADAPGDAA